MVCPECQAVAYQQLKVGAGVLVERDGALLLLLRGPECDAFPDTWSLPAGYCEADEAPQMTAARETAEETGLQVGVERLRDAYFFDDDPRGAGLLLVYEAGIKGGDLRYDGREIVAGGFFPPDRLPQTLCGGGHVQAIEAWKALAADRWSPGDPMRFCPHCTHPLEQGLAFDRVRPICTACGFVHFRDPKVGVSVLVEQAERVLLVQRAIEPEKGKWCLPSGFVEWDEDPETAAARECVEETGLEVTVLGLDEVAHYTDDFRGPGINLVYRAQAIGGTLKPGDDALRAVLFARDALPPATSVAFRGHRRTLERWRAGGVDRDLEIDYT
jgi:ADP-ribose pyrophosphatase YjhB (NUDIX family)